MEQVANTKCFGGELKRYKHQSSSLHCDMHFSIFLPRQVALAESNSALKLPVLYWLSGLTATDENFMQKAGAQRVASELGLILITPDTSPRGESVPDDPESAYDLGHGAGFYLNATQAPWSTHYHMYDYVTQELPELVQNHFPVDPRRQSISGHSMGGHGALTIALKNPDQYRSVSAFAPIVAPCDCPWGQKAFTNYLGTDPQLWATYDARALVSKASRKIPMLIDQGSVDEFLENQLKPGLFVDACAQAGFPLHYNLRDGYDHSYYFIASLIDEHLRFHAEHLKAD